MALLVELSLPTPEIGGLNPDIGKILSTNGTIEKTKIKKKRPGRPIFKKSGQDALVDSIVKILSSFNQFWS